VSCGDKGDYVNLVVVKGSGMLWTTGELSFVCKRKRKRRTFGLGWLFFTLRKRKGMAVGFSARLKTPDATRKRNG